jgi:hypothetical protein
MHRRLLAALAAPLLLTTACATEADDTVAVESGVAPVAALRAAPEAADAAGTARFELTFAISDPEFGEVAFGGTGAYDTDAGRMEMELDLGAMLAGLAPDTEGMPEGIDEPVEILIDGTTTYVRIPFLEALTGEAGWLSASAEDLGPAEDLLGLGAGSTDPSQVLEALRGVADDVEVAGEDEVRGVPTTRYTATVDLAAAVAEVPEAQRAQVEEQLEALDGDGTVPVEVWLDGDGLVRRMAMDLAGVVPGGTGTATMTMELFDYGEPVDIEIPSADEVTPLLDVLGGFGGAFGDPMGS